jgi:hypothetical protein
VQLASWTQNSTRADLMCINLKIEPYVIDSKKRH